MDGAGRRPRPVIAGVLVLALLGLGGALTLSTSAGTDTLVPRGSSTWRATDDQRASFGEDPIYVLVRGPLPRLVLTSDLGRLIGLEGCLSPNRPKGAVPPGGANGPCAQLAATGSVRFVFGPGTFINESVTQIGQQFTARQAAVTAKADAASRATLRLAQARGYSAARAQRLALAARQVVVAQFAQEVVTLGQKYGLTAVPRLNDPQFVNQLVFTDLPPFGTPKPRFAYLFPSRNSALVQIRLRHGLSDAQRTQAIALVRRAVRMPQWQPHYGGSFEVTGAPVLVADLTEAITGSLRILLLGSILVMALTLGVMFRVRMRLLPLLVALTAVAITFGALALFGQTLTMASIAVLPVLVGLGVDYAIQLQARVLEERAAGRRSFAAAARAAARSGVPTIGVAAAATAAGLLVVALSPVPMVRQFGLMLVGGIVVAFACALALGTAVLTLEGDSDGVSAAPLRRVGRSFGAAWRGAGEMISGHGALRRAGSWFVGKWNAALRGVTRRPGTVVAVAVGVAVLGLALETQTPVESNIERLVPASLPAIRGLTELQRSTGVAGEVDVLIEGQKVATPAVVRWMTAYQKGLLAKYGYSTKRGCGRAELCPAFSLPDLFRGGAANSQAKINALLGAVPPYFSQSVLTPDGRAATMAFGVKLEGLDRQLAVMRQMRRTLHPPPGITARLAGLPVLAAEANDRLASHPRRFLALGLSLLAVALVLLIAFRSVSRALLPLVPIVLATGWSALVLALSGVSLNPLSLALGPLVVAITTEFSVLITERYRRERASGRRPEQALERTYATTGRAVLASGTTAIAGFAVLILSDIRMLRGFGAVTVIDLAVALTGVLLVLPAVLTLAERRRGRLTAQVAVPSPREPVAGGATVA